METAFFSPAPYPDEEDARQRVVDDLLARDLDLTKVDRLVAEAAEALGTPMAAATILDRDRQWLAARHGLDATTTTRASAFCGYTIGGDHAFQVTDAQADQRFAGNPLVRGGPSIRFYAGVPLVVEGRAIGALCTLDDRPRPALDQAQVDRLEQLARSASGELEAQLRKGRAKAEGR